MTIQQKRKKSSYLMQAKIFNKGPLLDFCNAVRGTSCYNQGWEWKISIFPEKSVGFSPPPEVRR